jgi:hypothetical protein
MTNRVQTREQKSSALRDIYVARTVKEPQDRVDRFLNRLGRHLGHMATIKTIGSTHITFLESYGVKSKFRNFGYSPTDVRTFRVALQQHLDNKLPGGDIEVRVDPDRPLGWKGGRNNKLVINLLNEDRLEAERDEIEKFLIERFGTVPILQKFDPHVTLGRVNSRIIDPATRLDPEVLLPPGVNVPDQFVLNGLTAYLDRIQPDSAIC